MSIVWAEGVRRRKLESLYLRLDEAEHRANEASGACTRRASASEADTWSSIIWEIEHETRAHSLIQLEALHLNHLFLEHRHC